MADWTKTRCRWCRWTGDSNPLRPDGMIGWSPCPECGGDGLVDDPDMIDDDPPVEDDPRAAIGEDHVAQVPGPHTPRQLTPPTPVVYGGGMSSATVNIDPDALRKEIEDSRQAQAWQPTAIRSRWVNDLENLAVAIANDGETPDTIADLAATAKARQVELATIVARNLATNLDALTERASQATGETVDFPTIAELVAWMRANDITIDDAANGERDGWVVTADEAVAYATCRSWEPDTPEWVEVDLLTGEAVAK